MARRFHMKNKHVTLLVFIQYYLPGYKSGGPVRTIANLVDRLGDEIDFKIVTSDRDSQDADPYPDVPIDQWSKLGGASVFYMSPHRRSFSDFLSLLRDTEYDAVYLNSFFASPWTLYPLLARRLGLIGPCPVLLAPRGELAIGALSLGRWKKKPFMKLAKLVGLYKGLIWQGSSAYEVEDIRREMNGIAREVIEAPDLMPIFRTEGLECVSASSSHASSLRIVFLARISPMKNLEFALECLAEAGIECSLDIYGTISDLTYWESCRRLIAELPSSVCVKYCGVLPHERVISVLSSYDLYFLPTRGENFGHSIIEALAAGVPVLISDRTPWRGLREAGIGADISLDNRDEFLREIRRFARLDVTERQARSARARRYAESISNDQVAVGKNRHLFKQIAASGKC